MLFSHSRTVFAPSPTFFMAEALDDWEAVEGQPPCPLVTVDGVLAAVFDFCDGAALLACRLVCRRWDTFPGHTWPLVIAAANECHERQPISRRVSRRFAARRARRGCTAADVAGVGDAALNGSFIGLSRQASSYVPDDAALEWGASDHGPSFAAPAPSLRVDVVALLRPCREGALCSPTPGPTAPAPASHGSSEADDGRFERLPDAWVVARELARPRLDGGGSAAHDVIVVVEHERCPRAALARYWFFASECASPAGAPFGKAVLDATDPAPWVQLNGDTPNTAAPDGLAGVSPGAGARWVGAWSVVVRRPAAAAAVAPACATIVVDGTLAPAVLEQAVAGGGARLWTATTDADGWQYGVAFSLDASFDGTATWRCPVRRRQWRRVAAYS